MLKKSIPKNVVAAILLVLDLTDLTLSILLEKDKNNDRYMKQHKYFDQSYLYAISVVAVGIP